MDCIYIDVFIHNYNKKKSLPTYLRHSTTFLSVIIQAFDIFRGIQVICILFCLTKFRVCYLVVLQCDQIVTERVQP